MAFTFAVTAVIITVAMTVMAAVVFVAFTHPVFANEIDRPTTCVVAPTVLAPVLLVAWWHVQIHGRLLHIVNRACDQNRLRVDKAGLWEVANIDLAIHTGLIDPDGYADRRLRKGGGQSAGGEGKNCEAFHEIPFTVRDHSTSQGYA